MGMNPYTLCDTLELVDQAVRTLSQSSVIFLDCEGQVLGQTDGILSLIGLGVTHENMDGDIELSIFLVDVLAFAHNSDMALYLRPLFEILSSEAIHKVVFDGRMDASELLHGYGVQLRGVLDLQIADVMSRKKRAETLDKQLYRLLGFLGKHELLQNRNLYMYVHRLNSLQGALKEHGHQKVEQHRTSNIIILATVDWDAELMIPFRRRS
jgi:exonuclease 3'-5' domain-containing protein 1